MANCLKDIDALADDEAATHRMNLDGNNQYKSTLGGFCTLTLALIFILLLISNGKDVYNVTYPIVQSREVSDSQ